MEIVCCFKVVSTIPPHLLINTVVFEPNLPEDIVQENAHLDGRIDQVCCRIYNSILREKNFSGTLFSHASIAQEMYDHSTFDNTGFALKGFLNGGSIL
jgi:monoamine oxidase